MIKIHKSPEYVKLLNQNIYNKNGLIGSIFYSNKCGKFKILDHINKNIYEIQFINTNTIYHVSRANIISGEIKDYTYPTIYSVACLGVNCKKIKNNDPELYKILLMRYYDIISRCYNPIDSSYEQYGKIGVKVDDRWLNFSNFYEDIVSMKEFNRDEFLTSYIAIDKDKKQQNVPTSERVYSKDTVCLLTRKENNFFRDNMLMGHKHSIYFIYSYNGEEFIGRNMSKFARDNHLSIKHIRKVLYGETVPKKYNFRYPTKRELEMIQTGSVSVGDRIK